MKERAEVSEQDQWNVSALFPSFQEWEKELARVSEKPTIPHWPQLQILRTHLKESAEKLREVLQLSFMLSRQLETLYTYAHLRHDEDITHDAHKNAYQRISSLLYDFQQESAWIEPEILELPADLMEHYLNSP